MTGKERAAFRAQANGLEPLFQIGKGGISDAFIEQVDGALKKRELIKFKLLLDTSPVSAREAADAVAARTNAEVIQVIGGVVVLYRLNPELHKKPEKKQAAPAYPYIRDKKRWADAMKRRTAAERKAERNERKRSAKE